MHTRIDTIANLDIWRHFAYLVKYAIWHVSFCTFS